MGEAADAFRNVIVEIPAKLERGAKAFGEAADALRSYAHALRRAQDTAVRVTAMLSEADHQSWAWSSQVDAYNGALAQATAVGGLPPGGPPPPSADPGAAQRAHATRILEEARADVEAAAQRSATRLRAVAAAAPNEPGLLSKVWHQVREFGAGAWEATYSLGEFVFKLSPVYQVIDPVGYAENLVGLGKGLVYGATHPVAFAKAVTDWETWVDSPARALGHLVPDLALALATAGGGAVLKGRSAATRLAAAGDEVGTLLAVGRAIPPPQEGMRVYRVWGQAEDAGGNLIPRGSRPWGESWTPVRPDLTPDFRQAAGLPDENPARFLSEGVLRKPENVTEVREALELHGNRGRWPEYLIDDSEQAVELSRVSGVNEPWTHRPGDWVPDAAP